MKKALKRSLAMFLAAVMVFGAAPLSGFVGLGLPDISSWFAPKAEASEYIEGFYTYTVDSYGNATIEDVDASISGVITTPLTLGGYPVTCIGKYAFEECTSLTNITIPNCIINIEDGAFYGCNTLESITLPFIGNDRGGSGSITDVFGYIFGQTSLASTEPGTTTQCYNVDAKRGNLFNQKYYIPSTLKTVVITDETILPFGAFSYCSELTSITIPDSVTVIGSYAFTYCTSLTSITIPDSVTSIGNAAFKGCNNLTSITIPDNVAIIGKEAFKGCDYLTSVTIGNGVTSIGDYAFGGCVTLTSIRVPNSVTSIGQGAFRSCRSLVKATIPNSVTNIGWYAFEDCTSLTSVTIGNGVTSIDRNAFGNCTSLTSITVDEANANYSSDKYGALFNKAKTELILYPEGNTRTNYSVPDSVTSIGYAAFSHCKSLTSITIPDSVTSIDDYAFHYCDSLESITIPDSVKIIGVYAFLDCTNLFDVFYVGTEVQWSEILIGYGNECLNNATIHYNYSDGSDDSDAPSAKTVDIKFGQAEYTINREKTIEITATITSTDNINGITVDWSCGEPNAVEISNIQKINSADEKSATLSATVEGLAEGTYDLIITASDGVSAKATLNIEGILLDDGLNVFVNNSNLSYVVGDMVIFVASQISNNNFTIPKNISVSVSDQSTLKVSNIFTYEQLSNSSLAFLFDSMPEQFKNSTFVLLKAEKAGIAGVTITNTATNESVNVPVYISVDEYATLRANKIPVVEYAPTLFGHTVERDYYNYYINGITVADFDYKKISGGYEFSFNAYNDKQSLGIVEIYQSDGNLIGLEKIDKFEPTGTSIYKTFEAGWNLIVDTINKDALSFRGSQVAKHTAVTVKVPEGGFIRITNDSIASTPCFLVNIFDAVLTASDVVSSFGAMPDKQIDFDILSEKFLEKVVEVSKHFATSSYLNGGQIKNHLEKFAFEEFSESATVSTISSIGTTAKGVLLDFDIDFGELCKEAGLGTASVAEEVFNAMSGPAGATLGILFWANKCLNYMTQINDWANTAGKQGFMGIVTPAEDYNTGNLSSFDGIILEGNGNINPESVLQTIKIQETGEDAEALSKMKGYKESVYYDISLLKDGVEVQPDGEVLVHIPVPDGFGTNISVMRYGNGKWEEIESTVQNGMITIKIDHFCEFAILSLDVDNVALIVDIRTPSTTVIKYGDSIILHADVNETLPSKWTINWAADNGNFDYIVSADGKTCTITPSKSGDTTFTVKVLDAEGKEVRSDTQKMTSKAGFFDKIIAFFKKLFGATKIIPQAFKGIF